MFTQLKKYFTLLTLCALTILNSANAYDTLPESNNLCNQTYRINGNNQLGTLTISGQSFATLLFDTIGKYETLSNISCIQQFQNTAHLSFVRHIPDGTFLNFNATITIDYFGRTTLQGHIFDSQKNLYYPLTSINNTNPPISLCNQSYRFITNGYVGTLYLYGFATAQMIYDQAPFPEYIVNVRCTESVKNAQISFRRLMNGGNFQDYNASISVTNTGKPLLMGNFYDYFSNRYFSITSF